MDLTELGFRVLRRRRERGWTQAELAELAGVSTVSVGRLERGEHQPDMSTVAAIARALEVTVSDLLGDGHAAA